MDVSNKIYICAFANDHHRMKITYISHDVAIVVFYNTRLSSNGIKQIDGHSIICMDITNNIHITTNIANQFIISPLNTYRFICGTHAVMLCTRGISNDIITADISSIDECIRRLNIR